VAKLADFGIAKGLDLTRVTGTSTLLGTPAYLAPEGPLDERSDLYSLGIVAYELLTGAAPFAGATYQEVIVRHIREAPDLSKLPAEARDIVGWLLAKDPKDRPQRASVLLPVLYGIAPAPEALEVPAPAVLARTPAIGVATHAVPAVPVRAPSEPAQSQRTTSPDGPAPVAAPPHVPAARRKSTPLIVGLGGIGLVVCIVAVVLAGGFIALKSSPTETAAGLPTGAALKASHTETATGLRTAAIMASVVAPTQKAKSGTFSPTGSMATAREGQTATLLSDGRVLIVGGKDGSAGVLATAELYDPKSGTFSPTGSMGADRLFQTATLLSDGRVLLVGEWSGTGVPLALAELYDPKTGTFSTTGAMTGAMAAALSDQTATLLSDGRVLVVGGRDSAGAFATAELYDPKSGTFSPTGSMGADRLFQTATLLSDGRVLIAGGQGNYGGLASAEVYDPKSGTFSTTGSMAAALSDQTATLLSDGRVLVVGGWDSAGVFATAELYDPKSGTFNPTGSMGVARESQTATLLSDGRVLVVGGRGSSAGVLATAELYDPKSGTFSPTGSMADARYGQTATLLADGRILIAGGGNGSTALASAEIYTP
jgi:hypothetical protein